MRKKKRIIKSTFALTLAALAAGGAQSWEALAVTGQEAAANGKYEGAAHVYRTQEDEAFNWQEYDLQVMLSVRDGYIQDFKVSQGEGYKPNCGYYWRLACVEGANGVKGFQSAVKYKPATEETIQGWDAISGATRVAKAIKEAALEAIQKAPGKSTPTPPPVITETPTPPPVITETPTPPPVITETPTPPPVITETPTPPPVITETPMPTPVITETPTPEPVITETPTPPPVITETPTPEPEITETPEPTPEVTETPTPGPENPETPMPGPESPETPTPAKPAAPAKAVISKVASAGYDKLKITWKKVKNASGYQVSRATSKKGKYVMVATLGGSAASYTDGGLTTGRAYYYKVCAFAGSGAQRVYGSWSEIKGAKPTLAQAKLAKATGAKRSAKLAWKKVDGASGYTVCRAAAKNGEYKQVKTLKSAKKLTYTDKTLKKGKIYYYKIRAYRTVNGKKVYGPYSAAKGVKAK